MTSDSIPEIAQLAVQALPPVEKPSRKAIQKEIRRQKALDKIKRKARVKHKAEKKLTEKSDRKKAHKIENKKQKLVKKIQARKENGLSVLTVPSRVQTTKRVFVKPPYGEPPESRK